MRDAFTGFSLDDDALPVRIACAALREIGIEPRSRASGGGSDVNVYNAGGLPSVNLSGRGEDPHARRVPAGRAARRGLPAAPRAAAGGGGRQSVSAGRRTPRPPGRGPRPGRRGLPRLPRFERTLSPNTVAAYGRDLAAYAAWLDGRWPARRTADPAAAARARREATEDDVYGYFAGPGGDGATTSVARRMAAVRGLYGYLVRRTRPGDRPRRPPDDAQAPRHCPGYCASTRSRPCSRRAARGAARRARPRPVRAALRLRPARQRDRDACAWPTSTSRAAWYAVSARATRSASCRSARTAAAVGRYAAHGRRRLARGRRHDELFLNARGAPLTRRASTTCCAAPSNASGSRAGRAPTPSATASRPTWSRAAPTCAACRRCSATATSPPPRSTRT